MKIFTVMLSFLLFASLSFDIAFRPMATQEEEAEEDYLPSWK